MNTTVVVLMILNIGLIGGLIYAVYIISTWYAEFKQYTDPIEPIEFMDAEREEEKPNGTH